MNEATWLVNDIRDINHRVEHDGSTAIQAPQEGEAEGLPQVWGQL